MEVMRQVAAAGGVLALLLGTLWWLRQRGFAVPAVHGLGPGRRAARRLECIERASLGPQQALYLIRLGDRALLVATSPAGCTLLRDLSWHELAMRAADGREAAE